MLSSSPCIAFVDLTFNWPPIGGCWIDTYNVALGLKKRGAEVYLFVPDFQDYYPRGRVQEELPFNLIKIPFNRFTFNAQTVMKRFRSAVLEYKPELIFLMDGYFMKNALMTALGPERCILRFYSYELMCINLHYYRYHEDRICEYGYFENPLECHRCWFRRMPAVGRALQIGLGMSDRHPILHFSHEYLASLAFSESYRTALLRNLKRLCGAIVYNPFMEEKLRPHIPEIHVVPSGVDCERYRPVEPGIQQNTNVKIFLPGRANDHLKGLPVLVEAGRRLEKKQIPFEIHYTAAMDCPASRPWLINRGWVDQQSLPLLYRQMDIVAVPSTWIEPFGITALEGMASGLPVVASRVGGLAQTVVDRTTGLLVDAGNADQLDLALESLILDPDRRARLGRAGRERTLEQYDWNRIIDRYYVPLVDQALSRRSSPDRTQTLETILTRHEEAYPS